MDIFNKAKKRVSGAIKDIEKKTNDTISERKLQGQIKSAQDEIAALYRTIGEIYYRSTKGEPSESITDLCASVDSLNDRIAEISAELDALRAVKRCPECGAEVADEVKFCPACGARQPEKPAPAAEEEAPAMVEPEKCPECGRERKENARFCEGCGHNFAADDVFVPSFDASASEEPEQHEE